MFIGWVFNALYIGFVAQHINEHDHPFFIKLFNVLQLCLVGMIISFPLQGYGFYSILFSTLHTLGALVFIIRFLTKTKNTISAWYARISLLFFALSTAGPVSLAYLMSNGMASTPWYNFSIYFYLHFQYNGFFLFGILSLFFIQLEQKEIHFSLRKARSFGIILAATCIPTYFLSTLWAKPGYIVNVIGAIAALIQSLGLIFLIKLIRENLHEIKQRFTAQSGVLLLVAFMSFTLKLFLQAISALPAIAQMAYELRPIVIAYLHLVLVGIISSFLFVWYLEEDLLGKRSVNGGVILYLVSFLGMEICLLLSPWWSQMAKGDLFQNGEYTLFFSVFLSLSYFIIFISSFFSKTKKINATVDKL
jgi:hypothetical protein